MEEDKISRTQLAALVWAGTLAPAAELLPAVTLPQAGKGAWLAPVAAIPLVLAAGWLLSRLGEGCGLARRLGSSWAGKAVLLIYIVWGELLLTLRLRLCARRLLSSGQRDGALWFFLLAVAGLALWIGRGRLAAFARAGQIFLAILLTAGGVVLLLSLTQIRLERVLPLWTGDLVPVLRSALPAAGTLGWGLWAAFLTDRVKGPERDGGRRWTFWVVGGCLLLVLSQFVILGSLGATLAGRLDSPFFTLAKSVGVEGAFQRVESVITALWTLADLTMAGLILFSLRAMAAQLCPKVKETHSAAAGLILAAALALTAFPEETALSWSRDTVLWGNLILGLVVPFLLALLFGVWGGRRRNGIFCDGKGGKT